MLIHLNFERIVIGKFSSIPLDKIRMLSVMIVEINSDKTDHLCNLFDFVLRIVHESRFVKCQLAQKKIEVILFLTQLLKFLLIGFKDTDGVIVLNSILLEYLYVTICTHFLHADPLVQPGSCHFQFLLHMFFISQVQSYP